jgi:hypothetical protein
MGSESSIYFLQSPKEVVLIWRADRQTRHIYLNVPHSQHPSPSWYGESVGHYEGNDTLVVDTIGQNTRTFVDNYNTPHTDQLHVVERFRLSKDGNSLVINIHVEDPGAFTTPWDAVQRFDRFDGFLVEDICPDAAAFDTFNYGLSHRAELVPIPQAAKPDF